ncbi:hypothetical protein ACF06W_11315 [Streptomyces albus]|uniref:hypothetical protein n=1 Tax=Streptomyces albus TaxID=1888 RepID=UPI0036F5375A
MTDTRLLEVIFPESVFLGSLFSTMEWAEEEIEKARTRHGEQGKGPLWNSFKLLKTTHDKLNHEALYRSHCREILERVAKRDDPSLGTDAEMIVTIHEACLVAPLNSGTMCLYFRLIARSIPELARVVGKEIELEAYERLHGRKADEYETVMRQKLRQEFRKQ